MINEIYPNKYDNTHYNILPNKKDYLLAFYDNKILLKKENENLIIPNIIDNIKTIYLFKINNDKYFYTNEHILNLDEQYDYYDINIVRSLSNHLTGYIALLGNHYNNFLSNNKFCSKCNNKLILGKNKTLSLVCDSCNREIFPTISPAVIVAITYNDKLLLTKYKKGNYKNYALVAGYLEVGETLEECVRREVKEEVGLDIYDIEYYKSQPWGFSQTLMVAYKAKAKSDKIILEEDELKEAVFLSKDEIPLIQNPISVGHELIMDFKLGKWK